MSRYLVGIDLGTTNIAVAYVDTAAKAGAGPRLQTFLIPQVVAVGEVRERPLLPSFLYLPGPNDLPAGAIDLPWQKDPAAVCGLFAREYGAKIPGRQISSAKSWLCHPGVDRTAPLLPWGAPPEVPRMSPLQASTCYLQHIVAAWNAVPGRTPEDRLERQEVVITVPASFDDVARQLTAEAARQAGLQQVTLLEEPQAAFYAWLGTHTPAEAARLRVGMRCLVVDVGGGTTDFSLIRVTESHGEAAFVRDAVGDHLLLGGDNMDLALARWVEQRLTGLRLDPAQFAGLVQACRAAKEALLGETPPRDYAVTVMGRGRAVVGGSASLHLTPQDVQQILFEGFFPAVPYDAVPATQERLGLQEMGLPYVADPAITRHLAAFLRQHLPVDTPPEAILFNGGVFQAACLRQRLLEVMGQWFTRPNHRWEPLVLTSPSLDLAVAWGAAYFAWLRSTGGRRIGGGIPRSYYIQIATDDAGTRSTDTAEAVPTATAPATTAAATSPPPLEQPLSLLCVVPRHLEEGTEVRLEQPKLELAIGQPVVFPLYASTVRGEDQPGQLLRLPPQAVLPLPPLHTVLRGGKRSGVKRVPVTLAARCTEIGTLELFCESAAGNRWKLEFNIRDVVWPSSPEAEERGTPQEASRLVEVFPEEKIQAAGALLRAVFAGGGSSEPSGSVTAAAPPTPAELTRRLEEVLETPRTDWPTYLCRRLWEFLEEHAAGRHKSPAHLARWYHLAGFVLRPGFGDPLDRYRVESLWKIITAAASASGTAPGKLAVPEGGAEYWIMWRRVAGGLNTALQQQLFQRLKPVLLPAKGKAFSRPPASEYVEMWRAAAALERLDARIKEQLGEALLRDLKKVPLPPYLFWSLTRLGSRVLLYGPLNAVVHPQVVQRWLEVLLEHEPLDEQERLGWLFCLSQLARRSGLRALDVDEEHRSRVLELLERHAAPLAWRQMVAETVAAGREESARLFGESLPIGLRLAQTG